MAKVLVTGGAGFIGSHIVEGLLQRGDAVRVLDNFSSGRSENLEHLTGKLEVLEGDLRDPGKVAEAVGGIELVFHQAAFVGVPQSLLDPETCFTVNASGTEAILEAARRARVSRVVLASSASVYGDAQTFPITEDAPLQPISPYAVSKQVNELYARLYTHNLGLPVVALRYFNVYGPRQRPDSDYAAAIPILSRQLVNNQQVTIFGNGKQTRDIIFVKDVARANLLAAESEAAPGETINICTGKETSMLDLMEELSQLVTHSPKTRFAAPRPGDIYRSVGSPEKAERLLGFHAATSLSEGLKQTIDWMHS